MSVLTAQNLSKSFGPQTILKQASLSLRAGERVGLVGLNGTGKSTLARVLAGLETPDSGTLMRQRDAEVAYLDQAPQFEGEPTAREVVTGGLKLWSEAFTRYEQATAALESAPVDAMAELLSAQQEAAADVECFGGWERAHQVQAILGHLGIADPERKVTQMSGGERRRVALARILVTAPALAILDEPTNHLDVETVEWLEAFLLNEYAGAILMITHDRYLLSRVVERTVELHDGALSSYDGGYEEYLSAKAERLAHEARTESNRQNFLRTEIEWLRRQPKARGTKQKARVERAEEAKATRARGAERTASFAVQEERTGKTILELRHVGLEAQGRTLVRDLDLILTQGERIGVVGPNGSGKTTLLRAVTGQAAPAQGSVVVGQNTVIAYFDQERAGLDDQKSIYENVADDRPKIKLGNEFIDARSYLERFLFDPSKQRQPVGSLSGGERARVALAKLLRDGANLMLLDEPTNDLDVATLSALEQMLVDFGGTCLIVTHDRYFLDRIATSILAFEDDGVVVHSPGNYERYREDKERRRAEKKAGRETASSKPAPRGKDAAKAKLTSAERRELAGIVEAISAAEEKVVDLQTRLGDPATYGTRSDSVADLLSQLERATAQVAALTKRWEELEAKQTADESTGTPS